MLQRREYENINPTSKALDFWPSFSNHVFLVDRLRARRIRFYYYRTEFSRLAIYLDLVRRDTLMCIMLER